MICFFLSWSTSCGTLVRAQGAAVKDDTAFWVRQSLAGRKESILKVIPESLRKALPATKVRNGQRSGEVHGIREAGSRAGFDRKG